MKEYYLKNKEKEKIKKKKYYENNQESIKQYRIDNKDKIKHDIKQWFLKNKGYWKNYYVQKRKNDPLFKLKNNIYSSIYKSLKKKNFRKNSSTEKILGCTLNEFKLHIEKQFEPWMNWNNRGNKNVTESNTFWDIDHIIPISSAQTEEDVIKLNHYTNLRPLCSFNNRWIKRNKCV